MSAAVGDPLVHHPVHQELDVLPDFRRASNNHLRFFQQI